MSFAGFPGRLFRHRAERTEMRFRTTLLSAGKTATGIHIPDEIDVEIELDSEPRKVTVPPDLARALRGESEARRFFDGLSYSKQSWFVNSIESAKSPETRQRRIDKAVELLREGRAR